VAPAALQPESLHYAVERATPSVVNIFTSKEVRAPRHPLLDDPLFKRFFGDQFPDEEQRATSLGSGVIVSTSGYILTNHHVVEAADEIEVALPNGTKLLAKLVGNDPETDLAVLRVDAEGLRAISFGSSDALRVGDVVLAVNLAGAPNCSLRKITAVSPGTAQLTYNPGSSGEYNPPPAGNGLLPTYVKDDLLFDLGQLRRRNFAIVNNNLRATDSLLSDGTTSTLDVVDGIVDMRAQYGKDNGINNGTITNTAYVANDGIIDGYDTTAPVTAADWAQVLAVRVGVLARIGNFEKPSVSGGNCDATTVLPTWSGSAASPFNAVDIATVTSEARCFRYRVFETVVPLRNMIWRAS
jgi:hypothetical protein